MNGTPWTPGPWIAALPGEYSDYDGDCSIILGDDCRLAAVLGADNEAVYNARLIAAAPELAEALETARSFIANGIELGFIRMPDKPDPAHDTLPKIIAALAKANGETP